MKIPEELDPPHYIDKELLEDYFWACKFIELLNPSHRADLHSEILDFHQRMKDHLEKVLLRQDVIK